MVEPLPSAVWHTNQANFPPEPGRGRHLNTAELAETSGVFRTEQRTGRFVFLVVSLSPMAHLPPHLLALLFLGVHALVASHGSPLLPSSAYNDSTCSESFKCGAVDIKYPFFLSNRTQPNPDYTSYYSCGYTDLKIFCHGEGETAIAILPLDQHEYTVENITYEDHTIILKDAEAVGKCPTITRGVSFGKEWLSYTDSTDELTFFFDCYSRPSDHQPSDFPTEDHQIKCKEFKPPAGSGPGVSLVFTSAEGTLIREYDLAEHCNQTVTVPVHEEALARSGRLMLPSDYGALLERGFELEWKMGTAQLCDQCEKSYGRCAYSEKKEFLTCLCFGGKCNSSDATPVYPSRSDAQETERLKIELAKEFEVKDLGQLRYFLGIEVSRSAKGIYLSQRKYIMDLLSETGMIGCHPAHTPIEQNHRLVKEGGSPVDREQYQRLVGRLIYLSHTRPDIAYVVSVVSQYMHDPRSHHLDAVMRIIRYLKGCPGRGLLYSSHGNLQVECYTDADWAGSLDDRRSTSGYCTFVGGNLVTWRSKKQNVVAKSTAEAELRAMAHGVCEVLWLKILLMELGLFKHQSLLLYCDNKAALDIAHNPVQHGRTKHIDIDRHFIKEKLDHGIISMPYVISSDQLADILTKDLPEKVFSNLCSKMGLYDAFTPS